MQAFTPTDRTQVRRLPKRGSFDRELVYSILDEAFICHVGFNTDRGPVVIPTSYGRKDDSLYIHGSAASRMLRTLSDGVPVCVTVTLLDALVLARSAFHHSMNYRSVVVFGMATPITDTEPKIEALRVISEHILRERWNDVRGPKDQELKATTVLEIVLEEASAKVRTGPPLDDEEDYDMNVWAGILPVKVVRGKPIADDRLKAGIELPSYLRKL
jgi:nitroimidazol reductase NimA-like FMN-containing flavoprotein (pyridoxamine 5'-phosphate oxidase superfamily)